MSENDVELQASHSSSGELDTPSTQEGLTDRSDVGRGWRSIIPRCGQLWFVPSLRTGRKPLIMSIALWVFFAQVLVTLLGMSFCLVMVVGEWAEFIEVEPILAFLLGLWFNVNLGDLKKRTTQKRRKLKAK